MSGGVVFAARLNLLAEATCHYVCELIEFPEAFDLLVRDGKHGDANGFQIVSPSGVACDAVCSSMREVAVVPRPSRCGPGRCGTFSSFSSRLSAAKRRPRGSSVVDRNRTAERARQLEEHGHVGLPWRSRPGENVLEGPSCRFRSVNAGDALEVRLHAWDGGERIACIEAVGMGCAKGPRAAELSLWMRSTRCAGRSDLRGTAVRGKRRTVRFRCERTGWIHGEARRCRRCGPRRGSSYGVSSRVTPSHGAARSACWRRGRPLRSRRRSAGVRRALPRDAGWRRRKAALDARVHSSADMAEYDAHVAQYIAALDQVKQ